MECALKINVRRDVLIPHALVSFWMSKVAAYLGQFNNDVDIGPKKNKILEIRMVKIEPEKVISQKPNLLAS